jgi:hypothetical protein
MLFYHTALSHFLTITIADVPSCEFQEMFTIVGDSVVFVTCVSLRRGMLLISVADPGCYPES